MNSLQQKILAFERYATMSRRVFSPSAVFLQKRREFYKKYWLNAAADIDANVEEVGKDFLRISKGGKATFTHFHCVNIDSYLNLTLAGDKTFIGELLVDNGFRVARFTEYGLYEIDSAASFMKTIGGSFVVKPKTGAGGTGVTTGVKNEKRLRQATVLAAAAALRPRQLVEEQIAGDSFRLLFLDGQLIDAIRRGRPTVIGDGHSNLRNLISRENRSRLEGSTNLAFSRISHDLDYRYFLKDRGLSPSFVPKLHQRISVKNVANENASQDNLIVKRDVHRSFHDLGRCIFELLRMRLVGIDVMAEDISAPLEESRGVVSEINIPPGLHYHELVCNPDARANVGACILERIFEQDQIRTTVPSRTVPTMPQRAILKTVTGDGR